ncbi:MAG: substrate-binding domain-containing protein, partial [Lysobacterales bacterium]
NKLGGADAQIVVVNKEAGRGTRTLFEQYFGLAEQVVSSALIIGPNGQAILTIAGNPQAIAYVSLGAAEVAIRRGLPIKILALDGVSATQTNVQNGTYGLRRPLNFVTAQPAQGLAKAFLDFVLTPTGQRLVMQHDFVPAYSQIAQH